MKRKRPIATLIIAALFAAFVGISFLLDFAPGESIAKNFGSYAVELLRMLPFVFILIGLFEVWVKPESIQNQFGTGSGARGYVWGILLGATIVGGVIVALPVADALRRKGAGTGPILTFLASSAVCRIPMTMFEASYLGLPFTAVRYAVSIPLIILTSVLIAPVVERRLPAVEGVSGRGD